MIRMFLLCWACFGLVNLTFGQVTYPLDNSFGIIDKNGGDFLDVPIRNVSDKKVYIFRTDADKRFQIHYSSKEILPDSTAHIRVMFSPEKKGEISESLLLHLSCFDTPVSINFSGFTEAVPERQISCPHFGNKGINTDAHFDLSTTVFSENTGNAVPGATITLIQNGLPKTKFKTNDKGLAELEIPLGLYYVVVEAPGFKTIEFPKYLNRNNDRIDVQLIPLPQPDIVHKLELEKPADILKKDSINSIENLEENTVKDELSETGEFSLDVYKPVNMVFVIDVSSSMAYTGKLDLLKTSMIALSKMLRPEDKMTIVAYATNARILLPTSNGDNHDSLINVISRVQAKGWSAGDAGLELGYQMALDAFIPDGNNTVIMATDGALNSARTNIDKLAEKHLKKGVSLSIVGIKTRDIDEMGMLRLAKIGNGAFVNISTYEDAQVRLKDEIKRGGKRR